MRLLVVGEHAVPALLFVDVAPLRPVRAEVAGELLASFGAPRGEVVAGRARMKERHLDDRRHRDVGGLVHAEQRSAPREVPPKMDRSCEARVLLDDIDERVDGRLPDVDERLHD